MTPREQASLPWEIERDCKGVSKAKAQPVAQSTLALEGGAADEPTGRQIGRMLACVRREAEKRRSLYPRWVRAGRMTQDFADHWLAEMALIGETLRAARIGDPIPRRHVFDQMISTTAREVGRRKRLYPELIAAGRLDLARAKTEIAEMEEVLRWLQATRAKS